MCPTVHTKHAFCLASERKVGSWERFMVTAGLGSCRALCCKRLWAQLCGAGDRHWEEALVNSLPCESVARNLGTGVFVCGAWGWVGVSYQHRSHADRAEFVMGLMERRERGHPCCFLDLINPDIVDIKPANMEDLTEVITASEFHPHHCNLFVYSSSKGSLRLCDMRAAALCDKHSKRKSLC